MHLVDPREAEELTVLVRSVGVGALRELEQLREIFPVSWNELPVNYKPIQRVHSDALYLDMDVGTLDYSVRRLDLVHTSTVRIRIGGNSVLVLTQ